MSKAFKILQFLKQTRKGGMFWESESVSNIAWTDLLSSGEIDGKEAMSKVYPNFYMNELLVLLSLSNMHPKLTLNITFMDGIDRLSRSRRAHAYANPLDTFEQLDTTKEPLMR